MHGKFILLTKMINDIEIRKYTVPFNDRWMKRAKIISIYNNKHNECFLAHQISDNEILVPGELENTKPKLEGKPGKLVYVVKNEKLSDDVRNTVKLKAEHEFAGKDVKFW